jgi:hypothetical protein
VGEVIMDYLLIISLPIVGAFLVIGGATIFNNLQWITIRSLAWRLVLSHTLLLLIFVLLAPYFLVADWGSPFGDLYLPYLIVPGFHVYSLAAFVPEYFFSTLMEMTASYPASVICIIFIPAYTGLLTGGLQWFLIGYFYEKIWRFYRD